MKNQLVTGKLVSLRVLEERDIDGPYSMWLNDPEVCQFNSHARFPVGKDDLRKYIQEAKRSSSMQVFAIVTKEKGSHIGNISLQNIDYVDRSAELAIIIGDKRYWGKGIGLEAWKLMMNYGFLVLNLHRLYCGCANKNLGMRRIAEKSGMKPEGRKRDAFFKDGGYDDILEFGILKNEYLP
ncbi:MAG: GNAT family protein [Nitrospirota bacterium]|mgnify:FL=1